MYLCMYINVFIVVPNGSRQRSEKLTAIDREGFEYGDNVAYIQLASSGRLSQCCPFFFSNYEFRTLQNSLQYSVL